MPATVASKKPEPSVIAFLDDDSWWSPRWAAGVLGRIRLARIAPG